MSESPTEYSGQKMKSNETKYLTPYFTTNSVKVMREEEEYPFASLIADVGGVLGLFIGFNFLMVWEWIVWARSKLSLKLRFSI